MCPVIRISHELYARLESQAVGFDTPQALIERLLDKSDGFEVNYIKRAEQSESLISPELIFTPADEEEFKRLLLKNKRASVLLHKMGGSVENRTWNANKVTDIVFG